MARLMEEDKKKIPDNAELAFKGVIFDVYQWQQEMYDGSFRTFERARRLGGTAVIVVLPNKKLLIVEDEQPSRPRVITFPGGQIDEGELPEVGARRELLEETGYEVDELILWKHSQPVSKLDWDIFMYIGRGARKVQEPNPGPGERITAKEITLDELIALVDDPRFQNVDIALDLVKARYDAKEREKLERIIFGDI